MSERDRKHRCNSFYLSRLPIGAKGIGRAFALAESYCGTEKSGQRAVFAGDTVLSNHRGI